MSRNRRRSLPSCQDEDKTAAAQPSGSSSLRSQSLSRLEFSVQSSSIYQYDTRNPRNTRPPMVSVAVGTDQTDILNGSTSFLPLSQSQSQSEVDSSSLYESFNPTFLPKLLFRRFPHILVAASEDPPTSESKPTTSHQRPIEPISEVPFVEPNFEKNNRVSTARSSRPPSFRQSSSAYRGNDDDSFTSTDEVSPIQSFTSYTEEYDREEPLITKTQKFYKKRAALNPKNDSEDSFVVARENFQNDTTIAFNTTTVQATDSPESIYEYDPKNRRTTQLGDTDSRASKESFDLGRGGKRLGSGMVFVNLYGDTTGRRIRLGNHGAVLPRPADNRWSYLHHRSLVAIHCPGSGCEHIVGFAGGQCPDWLLLHQRSLLCHSDKSFWIPEGSHRWGPVFRIHHTGLQLERQLDHADLPLQRPWWHYIEHDLGELAADRGLLLRAVSSDGQWVFLQRWRSGYSALHVPQQLAGAHHRMEEHAADAGGPDNVDPADGGRLRGGGSHAGGLVPFPR
ncbi:uncharacterized protein LOC122613221 isoform X5 [Drosophila teissieri]|uniref:uncharacterized protein LOC122613221 isoform X5 n=1 Tax=Drosophila teissieri TaxID=7243 RepID=UPI001CB9EE28|nr:uncharacterized protein LOC122613221 isoform X5 [Drosophila teissieri]